MNRHVRFTVPYPPVARRVSWIAAVSLVLWTAGCGSSDGRQPVSGTVTLNGEPMDSGSIQFLTTADSPLPAGGAQIKNGVFTIPTDHGLMPGTYKVIINSPEPVAGGPMGGGPVTPKDRAGPEFNTKSKLTVEVSAGGNNTFRFDVR